MWENFMSSLEIMGKGMLGIFSVIIMITLIVMLLAWISGIVSRSRESKEN